MYVLAEFMEYKEYGVSQMSPTERDRIRQELLEALVSQHRVSLHWGKNSDALIKSGGFDPVYTEKFKAALRMLDRQGTSQSDFTNSLLDRQVLCPKFFQSSGLSSHRIGNNKVL